MTDDERAREYANKMVPWELPVQPLQHLIEAGSREGLSNVYARAFLAGLAAERERCAKLAEAEAASARRDAVYDGPPYGPAWACEHVAAAIRATPGGGP